MKKKCVFPLMILIVAVFMFGCKNNGQQNADLKKTDSLTTKDTVSANQKKVNEYAVVKLSTDLSGLTAKEKQMLPILFDAAQIMDDIYWQENFGDKDKLLSSIKDEATKKFAMMNYGPWDQLDAYKPFVEGYGPKPAGAQFYPTDMTKEEFEKFTAKDKKSLYTMVRRDKDGKLITIPYHEFFKDKITKAADLLKQAAQLAEDAGLKKYLELRAQALLTDDYFASDIAWMDMKNNSIDFVVGPIENYTDALFEYRAAHEAFVLLKDKEWSQKLAKYVKMLPGLQKGLPVDEKFKKEIPGSDSDLGVYYVLDYAGDCNAGGKTIAINLPNDEKVQLQKGTRKLQLKNSMRAKFDNILVPISNMLTAEAERKHIKFDAFFENVMFHETGHGLGIKNTITKKGTVREALKEKFSSLEEAKADIMGLYLVSKLNEMGEFPGKDMMDNYVTFMAGIIRSVRFGAGDAHGKANMIEFAYFEQNGAFTHDEATGTYSVNFDKMKAAVNSLLAKIIEVQGNGDYDAAKAWIEKDGVVKESLQKDLDRVAKGNIPKDIIFDQGKSVLGL